MIIVKINVKKKIAIYGYIVSTIKLSILLSTSSLPFLETLENSIISSPGAKSIVLLIVFRFFSLLLDPTLSALLKIIVTGIS